MPQVMYATLDGRQHRLVLPTATSLLMPGVTWGRFDELLTPAFWRGQAWQHDSLGTYRDVRLGRTLVEEVAACLLGGFGMPAELGLSAFARLRDRGLLRASTSAADLERSLSEPLLIGERIRSYRFPRQKARYLAACLRELHSLPESESDVELRNQLTDLPGIGFKTASWIVRNHRSSSAVAVIDVHILRAGQYIGLFSREWNPQSHYKMLEEEFLRFAKALAVPAAQLDALIWDYMRRLSSARLVPLGSPSTASPDD